MKIVHVIQSVETGGASRAMITLAKALSQYEIIQQSIISLLPVEPLGVNLEQQVKLFDVIENPSSQQIITELKRADVIHIHYWNNPALYQFLQLDLPPSRILMWCHAAGDTVPQVITKEAIDFADTFVACTPYTIDKLYSNNLVTTSNENKIKFIYAVTDVDRIQGIKKHDHATFNVGYIGTTTPVKLHPNYVEMCANINVPNICFIVCGYPTGLKNLEQQAIRFNIREKFDFRSYAEDIKSILENIDVFGYPLCPNNYSAAEMVLQEAMLAGIPPVIFPYGGVQKIVTHQETGLIVNSEDEYQAAIEFLYNYPEERKRLGNNARQYAEKTFNPKNMAREFVKLYEELCNSPKTEHKFARAINLSGAEAFIESLGSLGNIFKNSFLGKDIDELLLSDQQIAASSSVICNINAGGIYQYQEFYQDDAYLHFWAGLTWQYQKNETKAITAFLRALELSFPHWRIYWYLLKVAEKVNNESLINQCLDKLKEQRFKVIC
ncbi:MAG: glycosyltransferase family 4 protein [Scytonematopsis contorta HA4267-MV1]|jgi:glycosyltransferase involved in cell wall biosynthesis|nr:glycosyltransferase family 4 protein [Scytonematopsis contorta HA4267-MV1]